MGEYETYLIQPLAEVNQCSESKVVGKYEADLGGQLHSLSCTLPIVGSPGCKSMLVLHHEHEDSGDNLQLNSGSFTNLEVHIRVAPVPEFSM